MAVVYLKKLPDGNLKPSTEEDAEHLKRIKIGEVVKAEVKKPRNYEHHKKFFALLQVVAEYHDVFNNVEKAMVAVKIAAGHCDFAPNPVLPGELIAVPKSISFASMEQIEFDKFYQSAVQGVLSHLLTDLDEESLNQAVEEVVRF